MANTILYNVNPGDNEIMATMAGNFNDVSLEGKIQFGSAWWFLDQKEGMISQLNTLSNMGLLSRMVAMLTDSRSYLSFPDTNIPAGSYATYLGKILKMVSCLTILSGREKF